MSDAGWMPVTATIVLSGACIAIAWRVVVRRRRTPTSGAIATGLFLFSLATVFVVDALTAEQPRPSLALALRIVAAIAGCFAAFSLRTTDAAADAKNADSAARPAPDERERERGASTAPSPRAPSVRPVASTSISAPPPPPPSAAALDETPTSPEAGFLGLVSHELRTPLTAMHLLLDRLEDARDELPAKHRKTIDRLSSTAIRLTDLVDSLLYYARIRAGRVVASSEPFDLSTVATDATEELRPQAERKALTLQAAPAKDRVSIESDPKLVRLVIVNLVSNAVKFTDHGEVTVTVSSEGDSRVVRVVDSGAGIPVAEQERIFGAFQNLAPTKHKHLPGIGLGLSLARHIVDNLGGRITVRSQPGRGSTFEVSLPAVSSARVAPARLGT
jgi:signal transduction histidine kinase